MRIFARPKNAQAKDWVYTAKQHSLAGKLYQVEGFPFIHSTKKSDIQDKDRHVRGKA